MNRRILYIAISLLLMVPLIGAYASGNLISGCPSSITAGSSASFTVNLDSDDPHDLSVSISPAADSLSVSGASASGVSGSGCSISAENLEGVSSVHFTATFSSAGTYTISASCGDSSDSCSITVQEASSGDEGGDDSSSDNTDNNSDNSDNNNNSDSSGDTDKQSKDKTDKGTQSKDKQDKQKPGKGKMPSKPSMKGGASAASGSSQTASKTVYKGSADNYLDALSVKGYEFTQEFNKTNDTYFISADSDVSSISVSATPTDSDATVVITGEEELSSGRNKVMINVTAENGDVQVYRIYVDIK